MSLPPDHAVANTDHLAYRRDIDGLRAIAVLSVLGFHAFRFGGHVKIAAFLPKHQIRNKGGSARDVFTKQRELIRQQRKPSKNKTARQNKN